MTVRQEKLPTKKIGLDLYFNMASEALESNDIQKALTISNKGLKQAELEDNGNWKRKFSTLQAQINNESLNVGTAKENIMLIKGIGKSGAEKLNTAGLDTIEKLANASVTRLSSIEGIGPTSAKNISEAAKSYMKTTNLGNFSDSESIIEADEDEIDLSSEEGFENETLKTELNEYTTSKTHKSIASTLSVEDIEPDEFEEFDDESDFEPEEFVEVIQKQIPQKEIEPEINFQEYKTSPIAVQTEIANKKDTINQEALTNKELFEFSETVYGELAESGFHIIKKTPILNDIFRGIDILAVKLVQVSESLKLVYILPIKISRMKGKLIVLMGGIDYKSNNTKINVAIRQKPQSYAKNLEKVNGAILNDIMCEGNLFNKFYKEKK